MKKGCLPGLILSGLVTSACSGEELPAPAKSQTEPVYQKHSVEEILSTSDDEELVKVSGEIVKKIKDKIYLFRGETGDIHVIIEESALPDTRVKLKSPAVIKGEVNNPPDKAPKIDVENIHYVF